MRKILQIGAIALSLALFSGVASADISALNSVPAGILATSGSDQLYGWIFSVNTPINVTSLGVYNSQAGGLSVSHDVGIFLAGSQTLLGSTTVAAGTSGASTGGFAYQSVSPFALTPGNTYVIAMTMPQSNNDLQFILVNSFTTAPEISYINSAFDAGSVLAFPTDVGAFGPGLFGPNFTFTTTPEPSFYMLMGAGFIGLVAFARRKRGAEV